MSETKDPEDKVAKAGRRTMTLGVRKTVEQGVVRQNFSHGRSKSVVVEKKRSKRTLSMQDAVASVPSDESKPAVQQSKPPRLQAGKRQTAEAQPDRQQRNVLRQLSSDEMDARARALVEAKKRDDVEKREREVQERHRAEEEKRLAAEAAIRQQEEAQKAEEAALAAPEASPASDAKTDAPATGKSEPAGEKGGEPATADTAKTSAPKTSTAARPAKLKSAAAETPDEDDSPARSRSPGAAKKVKVERAPVKRAEDDRRGRQRLTITNALDENQRERSLASLRRQRERLKKQALGVPEPRKKIVREVQVPEAITIQELANRMAERAVDVIKFLMKQGQMHKINDIIDADTAELISSEFGHSVRRVSEADVEEGFIGTDDAEGDREPRAPVVTIMGHVDHGKTSLLDALRQTNVVAGEAGGITQHIGAYQVLTPNGYPITFIDTPGHAAFTAMRSRGAKVTDIVVLVVAADDGVMPQTVEAINHAKAAGVPLIVAINKIDKPGANPQRARTDLLNHEIVVESMGGDTLEIEVSAKERTNLDKLLEAIGLQAEILELKANPNRPAEGVVIEAKLERGRGPVGTVLIQRGTLKVGQIIVAGRAWGRVRALIDDKGEHIASAGPSVPVEVLGFDSAPEAGDQLAVVESEAR
ncbi:MAG: translation initiation factor IF-2, partial [Rhodomicrobium sp.]|nr:translation initiation factor IF-2 [Rhodomicrobium sp.]